MNRKSHLFAVFTASCTFLLLIAGALVTSTGSGLAVPDWPLSFGKFFPEMTGGVFYEHGHRMIAAAVGALTAALVITLWNSEDRRWVKGLAIAALGAVILQGTLGGITVLYGLPPQVSILHAVLGQTFFCIVTSLAVFTSRRWQEGLPSAANGKRLFRAWAVVTFLIYCQLILGAGLRHNAHSGFLHAHLGMAAIVTVAVLWHAAGVLRNFRNRFELSAPATAMAGLVVAQVALGFAAFLPLIGVGAQALLPGRVAIVTAHVALGALLLATSLIGTLFAFRSSRTNLNDPEILRMIGQKAAAA